MAKVMFVVSTGEEAELMQPIYDELAKRHVSVLSIETGALCCDSNTRLPSVALGQLGMAYKSLADYRTRSMARVLQVEYPSIVVVGSDQEYVRRAFLYAAQSLSIPVLLLDVAFGSNALKGHWLSARRTLYRLSRHSVNLLDKYMYVLATVRGLGWGLGRIATMMKTDLWQAFTIEDARGMYGCQKIVVAGQWGKQVLVERGVSPDRIVVTGNPRMASLLGDRNIESEQKLRSELGIGGGDQVILFHTLAQIEHGRWNAEMRREFVNRVIGSVSPLLGDVVRLVLRIHPVENLDEYKEIIRGRAENIILIKGLSFIDIIGISDVAIFGGYSTMVLEATALGKPVIVLNTFNEVKNLPYEEMGLAICLYRYEDIEPTVKALLYDGAIRNRFLDQVKLFYDRNREFVDGKASERIADLIEGMVKEYA